MVYNMRDTPKYAIVGLAIVDLDVVAADENKDAVVGLALVGLDVVAAENADIIGRSHIYNGLDWTSTMQQTFEYYIVDPSTWKDTSRLENVISSSINWDLGAETLGSSTIDITGTIGECYVRIYLITIQNGVREKHPLGTFLIQTPSFKFDGKSKSVSLDAYTPLLELKENYPPLGYSMLKGEDILTRAYQIIREQARAPISKPSFTYYLNTNFVANTGDTWVVFLRDLLGNAGNKGFVLGLDELGRIIFKPNQDTRSLQPVWTYTDDNSSILYPDLDISHDLYGIPNVVEVIYSNGNEFYYGLAINDDSNSPTSTINRGRKITHRVTNPSIPGIPSKQALQDYAEQTLRELSTVEYTISYKHGYCPVRIGDCVRLNYKRAGINGVKAKVISQTIDCVPGCPVTEKATFTAELWR